MRITPNYLVQLLNLFRLPWAFEQLSPHQYSVWSRADSRRYQLTYGSKGWRWLDTETGSSQLLPPNGIGLETGGLLGGTITVDAPDGPKAFLGASERDLVRLQDVLLASESSVKDQIRQFEAEFRTAAQWSHSIGQQAREELQTRGWVSSRFARKAAATRPLGLAAMLELPIIKAMLKEDDSAYKDVLSFWEKDFSEYFAYLNELHVNKEIADSADFFRDVEKSPLTREQRIPVTCNDNRVLVVASAGSGKTSTIVAKAGYSLLRGYSVPSSMLVLAFNREAADEIRDRLISRLKQFGIPAHKIPVKTFHGLALEIIESATGKKPQIAPWTQSDQSKVSQIQKFMKEMASQDKEFADDLVLMEYLLGLDLPAFGEEELKPDTWNEELKTGFQTLLDEALESPIDVLVANWLTLHGVDYIYRPSSGTTLPEGCGHVPRFYLPQAQAYVEVLSLDEFGNAPATLAGHRLQRQHAQNVYDETSSRYIELKNAHLRDGSDFVKLRQFLVMAGLEPVLQAPDSIPGRKPLERDHLAGVMKSFVTHIKANRWETDDLVRHLDSPEHEQGFRYRSAVFLQLMMKVYARWNAVLEKDEHIDFDDMVNKATDLVNAGIWTNPFKTVLVDECQDLSRARAQLLQSLTRSDDSTLFCVGDDWQSINGFAGADVSVMSRFDKVFGDSTNFKLETTFRCPQSLCNVSNYFISKNPMQVPKLVTSARGDVLEPVRLIRTPLTMQSDLGLLSALHSELQRLQDRAEQYGMHYTVMVLGRYNYDKYFTDKNTLPNHRRLSVRFLSVHQAKGLEADFVILPRMSSAAYAFPCQTKDDSALGLAMPCPDSYPYSEERRLFYVAITRAKQGVTLITNKGLESPFFLELQADFNLTVQEFTGKTTSAKVCPKCTKGFLVEKKGAGAKGAYSFFGCNRFPVCKNTVSATDYEKLGAS